MTAIHPLHSAGAVPETEDKPEMSDMTNHDDVTAWAEELWQRSIDCDGESGPRLIAHALRRAAESADPPGARNAPAWVQSVTPAEIVRQRSLKWPDFHPEDFCHQCGRRNPIWWVEAEHWNAAVANLDRGIVTILCPSCFCSAWEEATGRRVFWEIRPDPKARAVCGDKHGSGETCSRLTGHDGQHHSGWPGALGWE